MGDVGWISRQLCPPGVGLLRWMATVPLGLPSRSEAERLPQDHLRNAPMLPPPLPTILHSLPGSLGCLCKLATGS